MKNNDEMVINIAVGGFLGKDVKRDRIKKQICGIYQQIASCAQNFNQEEYGFSGKKIKCNFFTNPFIVDGLWMDLAEEIDADLCIITSSEEEFSKEFREKYSIMNMNVDGGRFPVSKSIMTDWVADQVDISILLWDGEESSLNSGIWTLIQACKRNNIPSIWLDCHSSEKVYWALESYFDEYSPSVLEEYVSGMFSQNEGAFDGPDEARIFLWPLWNGRYNHFMKKYKAKVQPVPYIDDKILDRSYQFESDGEVKRANRNYIVNLFHQFDQNAVSYSQRYRTSIYLRAIMPFIVTLFLSVGFYTETILGFIYKVPGLSWNIWSVVAGIGFFIHGLLTLYVFRLSENTNIKNWHIRFMDNRFIAEVLRLAAHVVPYGIPVNYLRWFNRFGSKISKNTSVRNELRKILRGAEMKSTRFDQYSGKELLDNLSRMIDDQIIYHENSEKRYGIITKRLQKLTALLFVAGLTIIVLRGGLQFILVYVSTTISRNEINLISFIKSFANMLALIIPSWASYFSLKLSLCSFEGLMKNDMEMKSNLVIIKKTVEDFKKKNKISFENVYDLSRDLAQVMLGDPVEWYSQISVNRLTKL